MSTVIATFTRLDEHCRPLETLSVGADKGHRDSACAAWRAAPLVRTHSTVVGPVEADTRAFSIGQADGLGGFLGRGALLPFLGGDCEAVARPHGTDSRFSLQFALRVFVGDARRNAYPTAAGALGPVSGLDGTLLL